MTGRLFDLAGRIASVGVATLFLVGGVRAELSTNGDFAALLPGWTFTSGVAVEEGAAVIRDGPTSLTQLYQVLAFPAGPGFIEFDWSEALSEVVTEGGLRDTFFVSLYFLGDLEAASFDPDAAPLDASARLMDLDFEGPFNLGGALSASPAREGWNRFSAGFDTPHRNLAVVFELADQNLVNGDSAVRIDNVSIVIPEPAAAALALTGAAGLWLLRRRRGA